MPSASGGGTRCDEPYRTLLGHMRHESGHYYWDRLIAAPTRSSTSSERSSATNAPTTVQALQRHYAARRAGRLAGSLRQRLRQRASVGGLGRDLGPLPAHGRHARNRRRVRPVLRRDAPTNRRSPTVPTRVAGTPPAFVRSPDRQLVSADLRPEQPESRPRARRRLSVRPVTAGDCQAAVRPRSRRPREVFTTFGRTKATLRAGVPTRRLFR